MPKELHEISQFMSGTVTTPSETDITDDTASYSLNIDPIAEDGKLTGVPVDSTLIVHDTTATSVTSASAGAIAFDVTTIVVAATAAFSAPSATDYIWFVDTDGNKMLCGYTGKTSFEFTGVTWLGPGTGGLAISAAVYQAPNATLNIEQIEVINDNGTYHAVFYDNGNSGLGVIRDVYGSNPTLVETQAISKSAVTMQPNNKEVHIGLGNGRTEYAKWAGICPFKQFGVDNSGSITIENGKLVSPSHFSNMYSVVEQGNFIYGIEWQGQYVYKFSKEDFSFVRQSESIFIKTQGLCLRHVDTHGNKALWVYDCDSYSNAAVGKIWSVDLDEMEKGKVIAIDGTPASNINDYGPQNLSANPGNETISDIHQTDETDPANSIMWISRHTKNATPAHGVDESEYELREVFDTSITRTEDIWNFSDPNGTDEADPVSRTPEMRHAWTGKNTTGTKYVLDRTFEVEGFSQSISRSINENSATEAVGGVSEKLLCLPTHTNVARNTTASKITGREIRGDKTNKLLFVVSGDTSGTTTLESFSYTVTGAISSVDTEALTIDSGVASFVFAIDTTHRLIAVQWDSGSDAGFELISYTTGGSFSDETTVQTLDGDTRGLKISAFCFDVTHQLLFFSMVSDGTEEDYGAYSKIGAYDVSDPSDLINKSVGIISDYEKATTLCTVPKYMVCDEVNMVLYFSANADPNNTGSYQFGYLYSWRYEADDFGGTYTTHADDIGNDETLTWSSSDFEHPMDLLMYKPTTPDSSAAGFLYLGLKDGALSTAAGKGSFASVRFSTTGMFTIINQAKGASSSNSYPANIYPGDTALCHSHGTLLTIDENCGLLFMGSSAEPEIAICDAVLDATSHQGKLEIGANNSTAIATDYLDIGVAADNVGDITAEPDTIDGLWCDDEYQILFILEFNAMLAPVFYTNRMHQRIIPRVNLIEPPVSTDVESGTPTKERIGWIWSHRQPSNGDIQWWFNTGAENKKPLRTILNFIPHDLTDGELATHANDVISYRIGGANYVASPDILNIPETSSDFLYSINKFGEDKFGITYGAYTSESSNLEQYNFPDYESVSVSHVYEPTIIRNPHSQLGSELVLNGDFATSGNWTLSSGWTIDVHSGRLDGSSASSSVVSNSASLVIGKTYRISFSITQIGLGVRTVTARAGTTAGIARGAVGTFTQDIACAGNTTFSLLGANFTGEVDNVSVKEINIYDPVELDVSRASVSMSSNDDFNLFSSVGVGTWASVEYNATGLTPGPYAAFNSAIKRIEDLVSITLVESSTTNSDFKQYDRIWYKATFIYDGHQESTMGEEATGGANKFIDISVDGRSVQLTVTLRDVTNLSKRIEAIHIYRSIDDNNSAESIYDSAPYAYRLFKEIKMNEQFVLDESDTDNPQWETQRTRIVIDDGISMGGTYESRTGKAETLLNDWINYKISTQLNNMLIMGNCFHPQVEDMDNYIFKSDAFHFNSVNVIENWLGLPNKPIALAAQNGRIFAFSENNLFRIEPNQFYIEDTHEGIGCLGQDAVCVTEYGMCFADKNNIYLSNGLQPQIIGDPILRGSTESWDLRDTAFTPKIIFDASRKSFVVIAKWGSDYNGWAYNIIRRRWDLWYFGTSAPKGMITGINGEMYINNGASIIHFLGGATDKSWSWHSKKLTMGTNSQYKKFKKIRIAGTTSDCIDEIDSSEGTNMTKTHATDGVEGSVYTLTDNAKKTAKWLKFMINSETNDVDAISTIYRRRPVK